MQLPNVQDTIDNVNGRVAAREALDHRGRAAAAAGVDRALAVDDKMEW